VYTFPSAEVAGWFDLVSYGADGTPGGSGDDADIAFGE
ncbi:MAG: type II secretion system protein GspG, partial [Longimicrobiales bacterium]